MPSWRMCSFNVTSPPHEEKIQQALLYDSEFYYIQHRLLRVMKLSPIRTVQLIVPISGEKPKVATLV